MIKLKHRSIGFALGLALACSPLALESAMAKDLLVIDLVNEPSSLDPHRQWNPDSYYVYRNIFDNLLTRNDAGEIVPQIATEWRNASDTEVVFTIRDDVTFHNGEKLTAQDVAFSINRIIDPDFGSPQLGQFNKILSAEATGDHEVTLTTDGAYPVLLAQLVKLSIVPKHVVEAVGNDAFNESPVGSGPYKFGEWKRGVSVRLDRNDDYWGDKGAFPVAEFRAVPDAATRVANLQAGETDLAVTLDSDLAAQLEGSSTAKALSVLTERIGYMKLNPARTPFDDKRVRQAVAQAIDKEGIVEGLLGGYDAPVSQMATPSHFGFVEGIEGYPYDPDAARKLVEEAGATGKTISFATSPVFDQRIVQALAQMINDTGLVAEIELTDMATYLQRVQSEPENQPYAAFGRWSCACQDVDGVLHSLLHSSSSWSSLRDPAVDTLLDKARNTLDEEERLAAYAEVSAYVAREVPLVPLYQAAIIYGAAEQLDWQPTANESMFLNRMSWSD
ncbi:ABC transporter substrate-binding protein [Nitratireductor sp. ZSWI3]|uniref:ABC transporter substrate-binding protein n=1 Tax=Nitratireductor sp. ZSWI3 TaxID=2966359 RepID=UPI00214FD66E|nr:ABC transporter substrate-binding protein [Nitratireductor sp. ZSWI3]MCR4265236.1 ABC transporter substrate-binding protein [Nitratireductor sp. ZSWI3]